MNAKALIPLVVGLAIAGLAAKLGLDYVKKAEGKETKIAKLWTPIEDVPRGVAIAEPMLQPIEFPASVVPAGALADLKKIVGRVPHTGAPAGVPILDSMLLPPGASPGVQVPPGYRAVAVKINESSGVDYHLEPGCRVDVVGMFTVRRSSRRETIARTILENVEVAAVGQRIAPETPDADGEEKGRSSQRSRPARAVTLLVKPQNVPTLHLAEQKGKIKLSMRGTQDERVIGKSPKVGEDDLLGLSQDEPSSETQASEPSWRDKFDEFVGSLWNKDQPIPEPEPQPQPEPAAEAEPAPAWTMVIYLGEERRILGWQTMDSFQPFEIASEGPNIFEDEPKFPPPKPRSEVEPGSPPGGESQGQSSNETDRPESVPEADSEKPQIEPEPQELFE